MYFSDPESPDWVVITGATSGIGLENAKLFMGLGYNLLLISRNPDKLKYVQSALKTRKILIDQKVEIVVTDFSKTTCEKYFDLLDEVIAKHSIKEIKFVLNNVGHGPFGAYQLAELKEIRDSIKVDFSAHLWTTLYFKDLIKRKTSFEMSGFMYTSSLLGLTAFPAY